jgi:hypothetical protein
LCFCFGESASSEIYSATKKERLIYRRSDFGRKSAKIRVFALANPHNPRPIHTPENPIQPQNPSKTDQIVKNGYKKQANPEKARFLTVNKPAP